MNDRETSLVPQGRNQIAATVAGFDTGLTRYLEDLGLPADNVLVQISERRKVLCNVPAITDDLSGAQREKSLYVSKFVAACAAGLFDAALNFLWNETVTNLRRKVAAFDLTYFFDSTIIDPKRRATFRNEDDLIKLDDWELMKGCAATGLISDLGYKHLDYIRDMRNFASAAHPNHNQLSGLQVVSWLETCIKEVLSKEPEGLVIEVRKLLTSLRTETISPNDLPPIATSLGNLPDELSRSLLRAVVGMYTDTNTAANTRNNILLIAPHLWAVCDEESRGEVGLKYASLSANAEVSRKQLAHEFLQAVNGLSYLPTESRAIEIATALSTLLSAHDDYNNFYTEPPHARILAGYVPDTGDIPPTVQAQYVRTLITCRAGNCYGVSRAAKPVYDALIARFPEGLIKGFLWLLGKDQELSSRLNSDLPSVACRQIAKEMLPRASNALVRQLLEYVAAYDRGPLSQLRSDAGFKHLFAAAFPLRRGA
jgi:hypothetical protein